MEFWLLTLLIMGQNFISRMMKNYEPSHVLPGIGPDLQHATEPSDNPQQDQKSLRKFLAFAYDKNISTTLKIELGSSDVSSYYNKEASSSNYLQPSPSYSKIWLHCMQSAASRYLIPLNSLLNNY